jgi:hypothetical protein
MEAVFGYFERKRSLVDHTSVQQLHTLLRDGHRYPSVGDGLGRIEQKLDLILSLRQKEGEIRRRVEWIRIVPNRLARLRESAELADRPAYSLIAYPSWESMPSGLFERRRTDIVSLLKAPPEIRNSGFDLNTGAEPRKTPDGAWISVLAGMKALACWDDACLIFLSDGDEYLCWGNNAKRRQHPLLINQLVLMESTYLFVLLAGQIAALGSETPSNLNYILDLSDMRLGEEHAKLQRGLLDPYCQHSMKRLDGASLKVSIVAPITEHPGRTAFRLVADLYDQFGFREDAVPYVETHEEELVVSAKRIAAIG